MSKKNNQGSKPPEEFSLPPSGLAEDILQMMAQAEAESPAAIPEKPLSPVFEFADSLQAQNAEDAEKAAEQLETWITFGLASETFGLPVTHVQEILRVGSITRVPHAPYPVRGITNMRGRVLPVVDLRVRIGLPEAPESPQNRILVAATQGRLIGLLVDSVEQVLRIDRKTVQPPPPDVMTEQSDYILGVLHIANNLTILLDVEAVLSVSENLSARAKDTTQQTNVNSAQP